MARPLKTGIDYFPLDVDFFVDEKIVAVNYEFGIKGEIAVIHLLCAIYRNGYFIEWNEQLLNKLNRELPGVSVGLLKMIVERLVKWGFFDQNLFYSSSILTSRGIQKRYFEVTRKRKSKHASFPYLITTNDNENKPEPITRTMTQPKISELPAPMAHSSQAVIAGNTDNAKCLDRFFSEGNAANIETLMMNLSMRPEEKGSLRAIAESIVNEWNVTSFVHLDYSDWARHLINTIRIRLQEREKGKKVNVKPKTPTPSNNSYQFNGGFGGQDI